MKILALSDLHLYFANDLEKLNNYKASVIYDLFENKLRYSTFDCIVITGDIFEYDFSGNPYKVLRELLNVPIDIPIICCLGNHEFAYRTIDKTMKFYNSIPMKNRYNVHYLDIENSFIFDKYNFIGNVFWYDYSLNQNPLFFEKDKIDKSWLDSTIKDFVPSIEFEKNTKKIIDNLKDDKQNIVLTHTVPHIDLNWFSIEKPLSKYNQYSGCKDFIKNVKDKNIKAWFCGHTHKRILREIYNIQCINVGNDYYNNIGEVKYYVADV